MALIDKVRWSLLPALAIAMLASCGPPGREPARPAGPSAPFKQAVAPDLSPPRGADAAGALPSLVVSGEVAAFQVSSTDAGIEKNRDAAGSLPSNTAAGRSAVYAPRGRAGAIGIQDAAGQDAGALTPPLQILPP